MKDVEPEVFDVQWNPSTVAVDREAAQRSLEEVSPDRSGFTFLSSEPVVARLHSGNILWIWDLALRRVDSVSAQLV